MTDLDKHFENLSPLMDDCLRHADMTLAQLTAMSDVGHAQKAYIEAMGDIIQLSINFFDAIARVAESLARKLNQVN
jgi:hypothetical protein